MKKKRITIGTETGVYLKMHSPLPALLWCELISLLGDYRKFEHGIKGTRFDPWLKKENRLTTLNA